MVSKATIGIFRCFVLLTLSMALCAATTFGDVGEIVAVLRARGGELGVLFGILTLSTVGAQLIRHRFGGGKVDKISDLLLSLIIATNVLFLLSRSSSMLAGLEKVALASLCVFALLGLSRVLILQYWRCIPGMVHRVVIVGNGAIVDEMKELVDISRGRFELGEFIECRPSQIAGSLPEYEGSILKQAKKLRASHVVVSLEERRGAFPLSDVLNCKLNGIEILDAPGFYERVNHRLMLEHITPSWFIFAQGFRITGIRRVIKRAIDIVLSLFGLLLISPFVPFIALAIKLDSPGPILFQQVRVGRGDQEFVIYKFRTMRADAERFSGAVWARQDDNRVTKLGNFLRKSRIDELPQLLNVFFGDMSIVGPRPERPEFVRRLSKVIPYYSERHCVKPGITGWAQVRYPYGASVEDAIEKLRYDLYYIKNYTLLFDFWVMFKTFGVMAKKLGR